MKKKALIEDLQQQLSKTQTELEKNAANNSQQLHAMKKALEGQTFSYEALMRYPDRIYYMTGLSLSELDCLYECLEPFFHTIVYPDCDNDVMFILYDSVQISIFVGEMVIQS